VLRNHDLCPTFSCLYTVGVSFLCENSANGARTDSNVKDRVFFTSIYTVIRQDFRTNS
jgi:hypothetical protein